MGLPALLCVLPRVRDGGPDGLLDMSIFGETPRLSLPIPHRLYLSIETAASSPWQKYKTTAYYVRGSVDSTRYRAATARERFCHGLLV